MNKITYQEEAGKIERGQIFLNGDLLYNYWRQPAGWGRLSNTIVLNRCGLALEKKLPVETPLFKNRTQALIWIEDLLDELDQNS